MELNKPKRSELKSQMKANPIFRKIERDKQKRKAAQLEQMKEVAAMKR